MLTFCPFYVFGIIGSLSEDNAQSIWHRMIVRLTGVASEYSWKSASPTEASFSVLGPAVDEFVPAHLFPANALSNNGKMLPSGFHSGADIFFC